MENFRSRLDIKYVFNENIERVWNYLNNPLLLYQFCPELCIKAELPMGTHIWEEGNRFNITFFETNSNNELKLRYTFLESMSEPYHKYIKFNIEIENNLNCVVKKTLYHVSSNNATVVIYEMCNSEICDDYQIKIIQDLFMKVLTHTENELKKEVSDLFQYEGLCINVSCDKLIREVINGKKMESIERISKKYFKTISTINQNSPTNNSSSSINYELDNINSIEKFGEYLLNKIIRVVDYEDQITDYRIKNFIRDEYEIKTIVDFESLTKNEYKINLTRFTFVNIDESHSHFSICDFFDSRENNNVLEKLSQRKLEILTVLKETLEQQLHD